MFQLLFCKQVSNDQGPLFFSIFQMNDIVIKPSKKRDKKFDALLPSGKVVSFGAKGYSDYTIHKDSSRKQNYLARHKHDPTSLYTPGGLARDILWSKPSL